MSAWAVKPRRAPSRHCWGARWSMAMSTAAHDPAPIMPTCARTQGSFVTAGDHFSFLFFINVGLSVRRSTYIHASTRVRRLRKRGNTMTPTAASASTCCCTFIRASIYRGRRFGGTASQHRGVSGLRPPGSRRTPVLRAEIRLGRKSTCHEGNKTTWASVEDCQTKAEINLDRYRLGHGRCTVVSLPPPPGFSSDSKIYRVKGVREKNNPTLHSKQMLYLTIIIGKKQEIIPKFRENTEKKQKNGPLLSLRKKEDTGAVAHVFG